MPVNSIIILLLKANGNRKASDSSRAKLVVSAGSSSMTSKRLAVSFACSFFWRQSLARSLLSMSLIYGCMPSVALPPILVIFLLALIVINLVLKHMSVLEFLSHLDSKSDMAVSMVECRLIWDSDGWKHS
jgi:hypothetical protein